MTLVALLDLLLRAEWSNGVLCPCQDSFSLFRVSLGKKNWSARSKPPTFSKKTYTLSHSRICPVWD